MECLSGHPAEAQVWPPSLGVVVAARWCSCDVRGLAGRYQEAARRELAEVLLEGPAGRPEGDADGDE